MNTRERRSLQRKLDNARTPTPSKQELQSLRATSDIVIEYYLTSAIARGLKTYSERYTN